MLSFSVASCAPIMDVQVAILCDAATDNSGKLNVLGTFDTIYTTQLPAIHPQCSIALRMTFSKGEEGAHKVRLTFMDEDGKSVMPNIDMPVEVKVPDDSIFVSRNFIVNIHQLKFERPGLYSVDIAMNDRQVGSIPLLVKQMAPKEEPASF
jgi:hypothetical protein